jgi:hypothetical protein
MNEMNKYEFERWVKERLENPNVDIETKNSLKNWLTDQNLDENQIKVLLGIENKLSNKISNFIQTMAPLSIPSAISWVNIYKKATKEAKALESPVENARNTSIDGYRHAYASALATYNHGPIKAKVWEIITKYLEI